MRETKKLGFRSVDTVPGTLAQRFFRMEIRSAGGAVKIVEFMRLQNPSLFPQELPVFCVSAKLDVNETTQLLRFICFSVDDICHLPGFSIHILHGRMKIHKTTAFRQTGKAIFQKCPDFLTHGHIAGKLPGIKFRVSSIKKQPVDSFRKCRIMER